MIRALSPYSIAAISLGLFIGSLTAEAAQAPVTPAASQPPVAVSEDHGAWRREPFIGSLKKGDVPATAKGMPLKAVTGIPEQDIQLQGIMQADKSFHALINGRSVKAGDTIGGVTIRQISRYQVLVFNERKENIIYDIYQGRIDRGKQ